MPIEIRPVEDADLPDVRGLQTRSWQRAYRGVLSDRFLDEEVPVLLKDRWAEPRGPEWTVLGAWQDGAMAGFVSVDRGRGPGAFVDNLHTAADMQGRGIGRRLMAEAAKMALSEDIASLWLTVIRENLAARRFYSRIGGVEGAQTPYALFGQSVVVLPVRWTDLPQLASLARPIEKG